MPFEGVGLNFVNFLWPGFCDDLHTHLVHVARSLHFRGDDHPILHAQNIPSYYRAFSLKLHIFVRKLENWVPVGRIQAAGTGLVR